jgi:signal transduction histidine kinase/ligand-binding sensor domain-containing protein
VFPQIKGILLILSAVFIHVGSVDGQKPFYVFRNINTSGGLASKIVTSIIQDNKGFMWIGTLNGLQKFDGNSFITYHHDPYDSQSISSDNIGALLRDPENKIWISTSFSGFNCFNPSTGKNTRVYDPNDSSLRDLENSTSSCLDHLGNPWLLSMSSVTKYDIRLHQLVFFDQLFPKDIGMGMTKTILCDPQSGNLWINSFRYGICMLDPIHNLLFHKSNNPQRLPVFNLVDDPGTLFLDREENLWINSYSGKLYRYNLDTRQIKEYFFNDLDDPTGKKKNILIDCMMQDNHGMIWMGARKHGLLEYSPQTDSFNVILQNGQSPGGLDYDEYLSCLYEDREGNIWIGSDKGIFIFNPYRQQFNSVGLPPTKIGTPNIAEVLNLIEASNGEVWAATYGEGVHVFDNRLQHKAIYSYQSKGLKKLGEPGNRVWSFLNLPDGKLEIGSQHGWMSIYDPINGKIMNAQPEGLGKSTIINMVPDSVQDIWIALYGGLARWDHKKKAFIKCPQILSYHGSRINQVFDLVIDYEHNLWLATQTNGLQKFDVATSRFTKMYVPDINNPKSISSSSVQCITKVNDSLFALGTSSGGINLFNRNTDQFSYITANEGLPSNNITALYFQAPHELWVATSQGLCKVDIETQKIYHYGLEDGIVSDDFANCSRFYKTKDGRLLIGYDGGIVSFHPDSIGYKESAENVLITGIKIFDQALSIDSVVSKSDTITLSYGQNFITIDYTAFSFLQPQRIKYYYQLHGVDRDWVSGGNQRSAVYTNLSPGSYLFNVKCENRDGIASPRITSLVLVIRPPFWETWWFRCLLIAAIAALLYSLYRYRINQLLRMQAMRNEISKDLHDDLGATLGSISILSEVAKNNMKSGTQDQIYSLLTKISNNAREMVDKMSDIVWAINPKNENLERIIQRLTDFSMTACGSKDIKMEIHADDSCLKQVLPLEAVKNIYLIVKEAMNNAIKHSDCRHLYVSFKTIPSGLDISIIDDGKGFDPQRIRNGNGLVNMESRVKEMKGKFTIHSEKKNTLVGLRIPIT